jgi:hypothetical protein
MTSLHFLVQLIKQPLCPISESHDQSVCLCLSHTGLPNDRLRHTCPSNDSLRHTDLPNDKLRHTCPSNDSLRHTDWSNMCALANHLNSLCAPLVNHLINLSIILIPLNLWYISVFFVSINAFPQCSILAKQINDCIYLLYILKNILFCNIIWL